MLQIKNQVSQTGKIHNENSPVKETTMQKNKNMTLFKCPSQLSRFPRKFNVHEAFIIKRTEFPEKRKKKN